MCVCVFKASSIYNAGLIIVDIQWQLASFTARRDAANSVFVVHIHTPTFKEVYCHTSSQLHVTSTKLGLRAQCKP